MPLPGLACADLQLFVTGHFQFTEVDDLPRLGPLFNARSCAECHFQPALGGSGQTINELRIRDSTTGGPLHIFAADNILRGGAQKQGQTPTAKNPAAFLPATTGGVPVSSTLAQYLGSQTFHPFSDFLLHDMGSLGDGITSGAAGPTMIRTAPLWGVRAKS
jgi:Di-haem oxidoreductase, putative peroxidase